MQRTMWAATMAALGALASPATAQSTRPDAGTILETPRQIPTLPEPGGPPAVSVPQVPAAATFDRSVTLTPAAFRVQGNTLVDEVPLQAALAPFVGKRTDMAGLLQAAAAVRQLYRDRGYILTEAYLPQQQFSASGGTVVIQVLEARVGKASVRVDGSGISLPLIEGIVRTQLPAGAPITEALLEKPVLLLRDLAGVDAVADVQPGAQPGEADVVVTAKPSGRGWSALFGADNYGTRSAGDARAYVDAEAHNLAGRGDVLGARVQLTEDGTDNTLFRIGYSTTLGGGHATRLGAQVARTEYALGKQFEALGAVGHAEVASLNLTQPFVRTRPLNVFGAIAVERKDLTDRTTTPASKVDRRVDAVRISALGNFVDDAAGSSFSSYALSFTQGRLKLDAAAKALDQGAFGLDTAGTFRKLNLELQRLTAIGAAGRFMLGVQAQAASRNLTSAEQMSLGGPTGVRGYPVGEGVGDTGGIVNVEYRHAFAPLGAVPVAASVFYDLGRVKFHQDGAPFPTDKSQTLASAGVGFSAGGYGNGNWLLNVQLAWRTTHDEPASDPDRKPRVWLSLQKWL